MRGKKLIVAEIGINHQGDKDLAKRLIREAQASGCGAVKFQYRNLQSSYMGRGTQIGDEILQTEIHKTHLTAEELLLLAEYARKRNVQVGISFFSETDIDDFGSNVEIFDFFKSPSVELLNTDLMNRFQTLGKQLYVSLGAHREIEVERALGSLRGSNWTPLHCVSNYPTSLANAKLGYITFLLEKWSRPVGFSSHDVNWETCLLAMQLGASVIERHITLDKEMQGLDHSSSSTPDEFFKLSQFAAELEVALSGNGPRVPNQGEFLNLQNLGRSFYASKVLKKGTKVSVGDLTYRAPKVGLDKNTFTAFERLPLAEDLEQGEALMRSSYEGTPMLPRTLAAAAEEMKISIPVRLHDYEQLSSQIPVGAFEFHLSFGEVQRGLDLPAVRDSDRFSIHLPDYVDSSKLFDPFSPDAETRQLSTQVLANCAQFARKLQEATGAEVPLVGSFSRLHGPKKDFYERHGELSREFRQNGLSLAMQWLPPFAWYFGGSEKLDVFCSEQDSQFILANQVPLCMDVCHLGLGRNYYGFDAMEILANLQDLIQHVHISDTSGIDGEGLQIGDGDSGDLISEALRLDAYKVLEVWQGHLDNNRGFIEAVQRVVEMRG